MINSTEGGKTFDKIQPPFMMNSPKKLEIEENSFNLKKGSCFQIHQCKTTTISHLMVIY